MNIERISDVAYEIKKEGSMRVPARIFASPILFEKIKNDKSLEQIKNVSSIPGILKSAYAMPDMHMGYGFPIGGIAAFDTETGVITPGGIGFDINCGIRLIASNLQKEKVMPKINKLLDQIFRRVPCGVGKNSMLRLEKEDLENIMINGVKWAVNNGMGTKEDIIKCESSGKLDWANPKKVSQKAIERGKKQLGTLGAGNHFVELQYVEKIYKKEVAKTFGLKNEGQVVVMIHCGSRGFGHQICSDYLRKMEEKYEELLKNLAEKDLAYAPFNSKIGQDYFGAMAAAANFAWTNRHVIGHQVTKSFDRVFDEFEMNTVYDVAHNIAKLENHQIDNTTKEILVHRKGATRCFPAFHDEIPEPYKEHGHPVLIPGSMGTASYVSVGTKESMNISFGSTSHGAGRVMSRYQAKKLFKGEHIKNELAKKDIIVKSASYKGISEEAPEVYKDVDEVISVTEKAGITTTIAKLKPLGVIKG